MLFMVAFLGGKVEQVFATMVESGGVWWWCGGRRSGAAVVVVVL